MSQTRGLDANGVEVTDDGVHGYNWTYSYLGVLYAKGWIRTRDEWTARFVAEHNGRVARVRTHGQAMREPGDGYCECGERLDKDHSHGND